MRNDNFKKDVNDYYEDRAIELLNRNSNILTYRRNNIKCNDFDLIATDLNRRSTLIDVQYSFNLKRYGDLRIDLMSFGTLKPEHKKTEIAALNRDINNATYKYEKLKEIMNIGKKGKLFDKRLAGVFYFFYDGPNNAKTLDDYKNMKESCFFFLPQAVILNELKEKGSKIITLKINDKKKNNLTDHYHSAFMCINMDQLASKYKIPIMKTEQNITEANKIIQILHNHRHNIIVEKKKKPQP